MSTATLTVVIPSWNGRDRLQRCLDSLRMQTRPADAVIVVDDGSTDDTVSMVAAQYPEVQVVALPGNGGFCRAVNAGILAATTDAVMTLNNDMTLDPDCLALLMAAWSPDTIAGPLVLFDDDPERVYAAGDLLLPNGRPESIGFRHSTREMPFNNDTIAGITAGAAVYPRGIFERVGYFDERFVAYFDDMDVALRARWVGVQPVLVTGARAAHEGAASIKERPWWRTRQCWRNHLLLVIKHWPKRHLLRHGWPIARESLSGMRRTFDAVRCDRGALRALPATLSVPVEWLVLIPYAFAQRLRIARMRTAPVSGFEHWLTPPDSQP